MWPKESVGKANGVDSPEKIAAVILKFEQFGFTVQNCVEKMQTEWQSVQTLIRLHLDLGLHCLPRSKYMYVG